MKPLDHWRGHFGDAYTERNKVDWHSRAQAWRVMTKDLAVRNALEVGCNRGVNLTALRQVHPAWVLAGLEPNAAAREAAMAAEHLVLNGSADRIPFQDENFDLVFTVGVLIHVQPESLDASLRELYRVSRRYLLAVEYHADVPTEVVYRGQRGLLWKRNYMQEYLQRFANLRLVRSGYWAVRDGFDRCHWCLLEKPT